MKIWGVPHAPGARGTKSRGHFIAVKDKRVGWVVRSWPRKRGSYQSQRQREWGDLWKQINAWCRQVDYATAKFALEVTKDTIFMPRDVMIKIATGRFWTVQLDTGVTMWSFSLVADEVQALLDSITMEAGSLLLRSPDGWIGVVRGEAGQVLTSTGLTGTVAWSTPAAAGGGASWLYQPRGSAFSSNHATKGSLLVPLFDIKAKMLFLPNDATAGQVLAPGIYKLDAAWTITEIVAAPGTYSAPGGFDPRMMQLDGDTLLEAGSRYVLALTNATGSPTADCKLRLGTGGFTGAPELGPATPVHLDSIAPSPGQTFSTEAGNYCTGLLGEF